MIEYTLFYLAFKNIASRFRLYFLSFFALILSISAHYGYYVIFRCFTEEALAGFVNRFNLIFVVLIGFVFLLSAFVVFLVFRLTLSTRESAFAVYSTFGAKKTTLSMLIFLEYLITLVVSSVISVVLVTVLLYLNRENLVDIALIPASFSGMLYLLSLSVRSIFIVGGIAFVSFLVPTLILINKDPSLVIRSK